MKISIIGVGYVGLPTGLVLASFGNEVYFVDVDKDKINKLRKGKNPFQEPSLGGLLEKNIRDKLVNFTDQYSVAIPKSEVIFICVGTPPKITGEVDLRYVKAALEELSKYLNKKSTTIVVKSTVPVGTAKVLKKSLVKTGRQNVSIVSNPEFLREGKAVRDTLLPDRIVIGVDDQKSEKVLLGLYEPIIKQNFNNIIEERLSKEVPVVLTSNESAELIKYAANAFLTTKISFINEIANIAENVGADINEISKGIGLDPRIGEHFLNAGMGWGGSCFPKDTRALHQIAGSTGYLPVLLKSVIEVNNAQRYRFLQKIVKALHEEVEGKIIGVLGLAFKAGTDDVRESAGIEIVKELVDLGAKVRVYDPMALENAKRVLKDNGDIIFCSSPHDAAKGADALVISTEWDQFKQLDWRPFKRYLKKPLIIDGRNLFNPSFIRKMGFRYISVGRK